MAHKALLVLVYLFVTFPFASELPLATDEYGTTGMSLIADYTTHDPIVITSDDDFETQGWLGSGTPEEPYKIEGLSINGSSSEICVSIENTRSYFIIRNCYLFNGTHGIHLDNVTNAKIEYCEIDLIIIGIEIADSWNNTITHNTLIGQTSISCENGLVLWTAFNTTLSHNNCSGSWSKGIYHNYSDNCTISNNICSSGGGESYGIWIRASNYITLLNNTCNMNSEDGIYITATIRTPFSSTIPVI